MTCFIVAPFKGRTLMRSHLAPLAGGSPQVLLDFAREEVDLSGLDLTGRRFERCNRRKAGCSETKLESSSGNAVGHRSSGLSALADRRLPRLVDMECRSCR